MIINRKIERNTRELTQLISTFNQQVAEQHEMVDKIHDNTITAKEQVDEVRFKIRFIK